MSDKVFYRKNQGETLLTGDVLDTSRHHLERTYEGLIVDVILDHKHPNYSNILGSGGYNVGTVKVRIFDVNQSLADDYLSWADPIDMTIMEYPLIGEMVQLVKIRGNFFYTKKIPISRRLQENAMLKLNQLLSSRGSNTLSNLISSGGEKSNSSHRFGNYFKPDSRVRQLKHFEGDVLYQGRMGHSIRFGSSRMDPKSEGLAPNLILRTGQGKGLEENPETRSFDSVFGLILEDINKDASSIWMVSDQHVPFEPITLKAGSFYRSILNPPNKFDKASITLNSDRIVMNAKKTHLMLFSNEEIYLNSFKRTSIDSDENILLTANLNIELKSSRYIESIADKDFSVKAGKDILLTSIEKNSLLSKKNFIGSISNDVEPVVGGTSLAIFLARLIEILVGNAPAVLPQIPYQASGAPAPTIIPPPATAPGLSSVVHVITPMGPGLLNPAIQAKLVQLYLELAAINPGSNTPLPFGGAVFNSYDNYVKLANEDPVPVVELNEFEEGEQIETENNEWILSEPYYRVL